MALVLEQVRTCDGACCIEGPRFPKEDHSDCIYRDSNAPPDKACMLIARIERVPHGMSTALLHLTNQEAFDRTCIKFPQNTIPRLGKTGNCCFQWVENDN